MASPKIIFVLLMVSIFQSTYSLPVFFALPIESNPTVPWANVPFTVIPYGAPTYQRSVLPANSHAIPVLSPISDQFHVKPKENHKVQFLIPVGYDCNLLSSLK
nr:uncharacterized protein LOC111429513 [Onthophagus taurus]